MNEEQVKRELGLRIKSYRNNKNMTQEYLSAVIDLTQGNLSRIENGLSLPETSTICSLIENTDIDPDYLFGFLKDKKKKFSSIDFYIVSILADLPLKTKEHFKDFLTSVLKQ